MSNVLQFKPKRMSAFAPISSASPPGGLLRLHSRYGPLDRSAAQGGLCHEASRRPVTRPPRSSATRSTDNSLGGTSLHW